MEFVGRTCVLDEGFLRNVRSDVCISWIKRFVRKLDNEEMAPTPSIQRKYNPKKNYFELFKFKDCRQLDNVSSVGDLPTRKMFANFKPGASDVAGKVFVTMNVF